MHTILLTVDHIRVLNRSECHYGLISAANILGIYWEIHVIHFLAELDQKISTLLMSVRGGGLL